MGVGNMAAEEGHWTGAVPIRDDGTEAEQIDTAKVYLELAAAKAGATIEGYRVSREPVHFGSRLLVPADSGVVIVYADGTW